MAMSLDWQFLVVTTAALGALVVLVRRIAPARTPRAKGPGQAESGPAPPSACAHCASHPAASAPMAPGRTTTTPVVLLRDLRK
jgi:hypothetical protein